MKKIILLLPLLILSSCGGTSENLTNSPLIISEVHSFSSTDDRALELYNISDKGIDLSSYRLCINETNGEYAYIIELSGYISPLSTFVVVRDTSSSELKEKADLISENLIINGTQSISLYKNNSLMDIVGTPGFQYDYANNSDYCRKKEFLLGRKTFRPYDWVKYLPDDMSHLGQINDVIDEDTLVEGPHLSEEDFLRPFAAGDGNGYGLGGAIKVELAYVGDGDTTNFIFPSDNPYVSGKESVRYMCVDTPEVSHGSSMNAQPWGEKAKKFNNDILNKAKSFAVSSAPNYAIRETYGRVLGFVWFSYYAEPKPEDYRLLNFLIVKEGYSTLRFTNGDQKYDKTDYLGISYGNYMKNVELTAIENKIKVHGELDPDFPY